MEPAVHLELPTVEVVASAEGGHAAPGMQQSLWIATDLYQLVGHGLAGVVDPYDRAPLKAALGRILIAASDTLLIGLPFGLFWQHEEWHRAVLSHHQIHSFDDVYKLDLFAIAVNVSDLSDRALARLKAAHPADFVRMSTSGIEGTYELATNLEKVQFFHRTRTWNVAALWQAYLVSSIYQYACAGSLADRFTDDANRAEGADVARRDFTGADCVAWTYDLFRPNEPYAARGVHPSGVGVDRYRKYSQLSDAEQSYLRRQFGLSLLNFLDPALLGIEAFTAGSLRWNAHVRHEPTAFGSALDLDAFVQRGSLNAFLTLHAYANHERLLPGVSAEILRYPLAKPLLVSGRLSAWLQPASLGFFDTEAKLGGLAGARVGVVTSHLAEPFVEVEAKTGGWVAGSLALEPSVTLRVGLVSAPF